MDHYRAIAHLEQGHARAQLGLREWQAGSPPPSQGHQAVKVGDPGSNLPSLTVYYGITLMLPEKIALKHGKYHLRQPRLLPPSSILGE